MDEKAIRTTWSSLGLLGSAFSFDAVLRTTRSGSSDTVFPISTYGPEAVTLIAIPFGTCLLLIVLWLTRRYPSMVPPTTWSSKIPVFYFGTEHVDPHHSSGKKYQLAFLLAFIVFPWLAQLRFFYVFTGAEAVYGEEKIHFAREIGHFFPGTPINWQHLGRYRLDCQSYFPIALPWLYLALELFLFYYFVATIWHLFGHSAAKSYGEARGNL